MLFRLCPSVLRRPAGRLAAALVFLGALAFLPAHAQSASPVDPTLARLVDESLKARPELARSEAVVRAQEERIPQASAFPDPMLQLGLQNDGFTSIEIGTMPSSYVSLMATQTLPWPGKRALRRSTAELAVAGARESVTRVRLSTAADVRRAYLDLLLVRDRRGLLGQLEGIWQRSVAVALSRYESGEGSQSDVLRAQLQLTRIKQSRIALDASDRGSVQALNRLRGQPLDTPIETTTHIRELPPLAPLAAQFSPDGALERSPELAAARLAVEAAGSTVALAETATKPDLTVGAGFMFRGTMPPMWLLTVGAPLPIFVEDKQDRAVAENRAWVEVSKQEVAALEQTLRLRSGERRSAFLALSDTVALYEQGLLVQSEATTQSTLAQYMVGRVSFASVLEANAGFVSDQEGLLLSIAAAHRLLIAEAEVSLAPVPLPGGAGGGAAMPGAGASSMGSQAKASEGGSAPTTGPAPGGDSSGM